VKRLTLAFCALAMVLGAHDAAAQGFINPFAGTTLTSPSVNGTKSKPGFGVAFGSLGGFFGADTEIAYYPEVLDKAANGLAKSRAFTFSGDMLIGPKIGPVKPYAAGGAGNMWVNVTSVKSIFIPNPESISNSYFTVNVGGGVVALLAPHFGVRGDARYFRAFGFNTTDLSGAGLKLSHFDFWRAAGGLVLTF
jgi:hypothetical protein